MISVYLGSHNPIKLTAVRDAFQSNFPTQSCEVQQFAVPSGVPNQPIGQDQVFNGAMTRAKNVAALFQTSLVKSSPISPSPPSYSSSHEFPSLHAKLHRTQPFFVGIEAGLMCLPAASPSYFAISVCVILNDTGHMGIGTSPGWQYPPAIVDQMVANREIEMADVMGQISGDAEIRQKEGAIGYYSNMRVKRFDLAYASVQMALIPFLNPKDYFSH